MDRFCSPFEDSLGLLCSVLLGVDDDVVVDVALAVDDAELVGDDDGSPLDFDWNSFAFGRPYFGSSHESRIGIRPLPIRRLSFALRYSLFFFLFHGRIHDN